MHKYRRVALIALTGVGFLLAIMLLDDVIPPIAPKLVFKAPGNDRIRPFYTGKEAIPGETRHILETSPDATTLYYGAIHYQFPNKQPDTPLSGLVKWYLRDLVELSSTDPLRVTKSKTAEPSTWEVQSVDKLAGPIAHVALDRSDPARVQLAILYYQNKGEVLQFFMRIYRLYEQWDDYPLQQYPPCPEWKPSATAHASYEAEEFHQCANAPPLRWTDYEFPGSTWVTAFHLRQQLITYSRANDAVKFRTIRIPKVGEVVTPSDTETALPVLHSYPGPRVSSVQSYPEMQLNLAMLPNAKPLDSLHLLFARVWHDTDRYRFQLARFENRTVLAKEDPAPQSTTAPSFSPSSTTDWVHSHVIRYSLMTGGEYNPLSDREMQLLRKKPIIIQAPMTTVVYFPLVDVILTLDQVLESEAISKISHNANIEAISSHYIESLVLRTRRITPLDASENLNVYSLTLDQFATVLVVTTLENDILVYQRSHAAPTPRTPQATGYAVRDYRTWVTEHIAGTRDKTGFESDSEQQVAPMLTRFQRINSTSTDTRNWRRTHAWTLNHIMAWSAVGGDVNPTHPTAAVAQEMIQAMLVVTSYPTVQSASNPETPSTDPSSPNPALRVQPHTFLWAMLSDGTLMGWDLNTMRSTTLISRFIRNQTHMVLGVLLVVVTFIWNEFQFH